MGEFVLALLITGVAAVAEGRNVVIGGPRNLKAAYVIVAALGLLLALTAALGLADRIMDTAAKLLGEVLHR